MGLGSLVSYHKHQPKLDAAPRQQPLQPAKGGKKAAANQEGEGLDLLSPASRLRKGLLATAVLYELISKKLESRVMSKKAIDVESRVGWILNPDVSHRLAVELGPCVLLHVAKLSCSNSLTGIPFSLSFHIVAITPPSPHS